MTAWQIQYQFSIVETPRTLFPGKTVSFSVSDVGILSMQIIQRRHQIQELMQEPIFRFKIKSALFFVNTCTQQIIISTQKRPRLEQG